MSENQELKPMFCIECDEITKHEFICQSHSRTPSPDRRLTTKEALANVDMEKVGLEASIEQLLVILEAKDMLLAEAANGLRDALGAFENNNAIDWDELEQTLAAIKQALGKEGES